jgi:aminoglycoside phosphotransferase (APT) family kinase protein
MIFKFVYGTKIDAGRVAPASNLSSSISRSIAGIHSLPLELVQSAGLPEFTPAENIRARVAELDRFAATGKVPSVLLSRWEQALEDTSLFRFKPTVVHGGLNSETMLSLDEEVSGVLSWSTLRVSDPAEDFAWILGAGIHELSESILDVYRQSHFNTDDSLRLRATLYSEFEFARWLMFGISKNDAAIVNEAVLMLEGLAEDVSSGAVGRLVAKPTIAQSAPAPAPEDVATRPIELPRDADNELF